MAAPDLPRTGSLLPLLLSLPAGTIAGVPGGQEFASPRREEDLALFGPRLRSESELRYAALRPPSRAVVDLDAAAGVVSEAALVALAAAGAVVILLSGDLGTLLRLCHRVLRPGGAGPVWMSPAAVLSRRNLLLRIGQSTSERWLRVPLGSAGVEGVLATCRALGLVVRESRIEYGVPAAR